MFPVLVHLVKQMKWFVTHTDNLRRARLLDHIQEKRVSLYQILFRDFNQATTAGNNNRHETSRVITNTVTVCSY